MNHVSRPALLIFAGLLIFSSASARQSNASAERVHHQVSVAGATRPLVFRPADDRGGRATPGEPAHLEQAESVRPELEHVMAPTAPVAQPAPVEVEHAQPETEHAEVELLQSAPSAPTVPVAQLGDDHGREGGNGGSDGHGNHGGGHK